ncbi:MAG: NAD(P)-binding domain-containing protein [Saprospiraceae bacterium]|nr:NAD(P)-binding domain-containing protein [Saprospiraceae bacterium]MBK7737758.1 NAD(P)-binding domain-containing protein [Saprospiraceae bacterium]MBK7913658.1 NAD(P)-binding domain-containing protein [Saprospiraceae bacterium]
MKTFKIGVIGAGTMGIGIAQLAAQSGHEVILYDEMESAMQAAQKKLQEVCNKLVEKSKLTPQEAVAIMGRLYFVNQLQAFESCHLIIEAIVENLQVKKSLYSKLESVVSTECILASNTSSLSISALAAACNNSSRVIGLHFFNPVPLMPLVEIIPAVQTNRIHVDSLQSLMESWSKWPVVAKDTPGFIVNRIARPYYSEAIRIYEEGFADFASIDYAMTSIYGFKMGPFALMDFIGNDINYAVTHSVWESCFFESRYKPSFTQRNLVAANWLGKKTGKGYYDYSKELPVPNASDPELIKNIAWRILVILINEAYDALYYKLASYQDIEAAMTKGVNYPKGLLSWGEEIGKQHCIDTMNRLYLNYKEERYRPSQGLL